MVFGGNHSSALKFGRAQLDCVEERLGSVELDIKVVKGDVVTLAADVCALKLRAGTV